MPSMFSTSSWLHPKKNHQTGYRLPVQYNHDPETLQIRTRIGGDSRWPCYQNHCQSQQPKAIHYQIT